MFLEQRLFTCARSKASDNFFALLSSQNELVKRINRGIKPEKSFQDARKKKHSAADKLFFVKGDSCFESAHKARADMSADLPHDFTAFDVGNS